jgi:hypothetical protein
MMRFAESRIRVSLAGRIATRLGWDIPTHEAAHIVAARAEQMRVHEASVIPNADSLGRVYLKPAEERIPEVVRVHRRTGKPQSLPTDTQHAVRALFVAWPDMLPTWREAKSHLRMLERQVAATLCLPENRHVLHALAAALHERNTLDRDHIEHIVTRALAAYWRESGGVRLEQNTRCTYDERA